MPPDRGLLPSVDLNLGEMGARLYRRIGFEDVSDYKEYAPPTGG